jgi:hypothetical protein
MDSVMAMPPKIARDREGSVFPCSIATFESMFDFIDEICLDGWSKLLNKLRLLGVWSKLLTKLPYSIYLCTTIYVSLTFMFLSSRLYVSLGGSGIATAPKHQRDRLGRTYRSADFASARAPSASMSFDEAPMASMFRQLPLFLHIGVSMRKLTPVNAQHCGCSGCWPVSNL